MQASISRTRRQLPRLAVLLLFGFGASACGDDASVRSVEGVPEVSLASPAPSSPAAARGLSMGASADAPVTLNEKLSGVYASDASATSGAVSGAVSGAAQPTATAEAMVIRSGSATVKVDSLEPGIAAVQRLATALGGYVGNSSLSAGENQVRSATLDLRIPSARFDEALRGLSPLGTVESIVSTAEDVGEEFVDITARMTNARRLEERLITLLATRTGKLEDVLAVERELSRVREEIERYEGRLRYLRSRVATSMLSITIHEPTPLLGAAPGTHPILDAFKDAWRNFVNFVAWLIASSGVLIPVALMAALGWYVWRRTRRG